MTVSIYPETSQTPMSSDVKQKAPRQTKALIGLTSLFFMWGFITCLNDILIPYLKGVFSLNYTQAMLIQFCFFGAYFVVSVPAGAFVSRVGYRQGITTGLLISALGCLLFVPAALWLEYALFLGALFVLASGITLLQVSANPYVSALGAPESASSRLTMAQAFNSLGTTLAPLFGSVLILATVTEGRLLNEGAALASSQQADAVILPYIVLALLFVLLAIFLAALKLPVITHKNDQAAIKVATGSAWQYRHLRLGALGIFIYVGAEVSIGSFLVNFLSEESILGLNEADAANYVAYYWGGAMIGRFLGAGVMRFVPAGKLLALHAMIAALLMVVVAFGTGQVAMWAVLAVGLCNSIMFPTIFSLSLNGLGKYTSQGSAILCLAIVGGAVLPLIQGIAADQVGVQLAFLLPAFYYVYILYFGLFGSISRT